MIPRMLRRLPKLLIVIALALWAAPVLAQDIAGDVPEDAQKDLWCGTAFGLMLKEAPAEKSGDKTGLKDAFKAGSTALIDRALPIYLESGYTNETLDAFRLKLEAEVSRTIDGGAPGPYTFQDCSALIGQ
jgi:hypothetical protein